MCLISVPQCPQKSFNGNGFPLNQEYATSEKTGFNHAIQS